MEKIVFERLGHEERRGCSETKKEAGALQREVEEPIPAAVPEQGAGREGQEEEGQARAQLLRKGVPAFREAQGKKAMSSGAGRSLIQEDL